MTNEAKMTTSKLPSKSKGRRKSVSLDKKKARAGWVFVLPFVIGFLCVYLPIVFQSVRMTFYTTVTVGNMEWAGLQNYQEALVGGSEFVQILVAGMKELVFDIPAIIIFALFMAVLLNQKMAGRAVFRAILFVPVILATGIMESVDATDVMSDKVESGGIDQGTGGSAGSEIVDAADLDWLFGNMKVLPELADYVAQLVNGIFNIVNRSGVQMLIFLAGLQSISPAIYEASRIDGASAWETFWKITFPMISPMILVNAIYTVIDSFTTESNSVMSYVSGKMGVNGGNLGTAMAWTYFVLVILIIAAVAGVFSAYVFYQRRD